MKKFLFSLKGDLFGGLTAGIVALPLALAFGVASGAGAAAGLYGAIALGFFAALVGGTPTQISGPTGPMTVVFAATIAAFPLAEPGNREIVFSVALLAGILQITFGALKLGSLVRYIPYPVISGFMSGIGVIIIMLQIHPLIGAGSVKNPVESLQKLPEALSHIGVAAENGYFLPPGVCSLILGLITMAIVFFTPPKITRNMPSPLIALLFGTILALILKMPVPKIGEIPSGLPDPVLPLPSLDAIPKVATMGIALAILGTIDSLLTSVVADSITKTRHKSNLELLGQGLGNMAAAAVGGLPGAGATMRTVVNIKAGGTTRFSGIVAAMLLLAILLGLGRYASHIPLSVLAGILVKVGIDILDYRLLKIVTRIPRQDLIVMVVVFLITVFVDLIVAVGVGVSLASLMLAYRIAKQAQINVEDPSEQEGAEGDWQNDLEKSVEEETEHGIRVLSMTGAFFFGTTAKMQEQINTLVDTKVVIINCLKVPFIDLSGYFALGEMVSNLHDKGVKPIVIFKNGAGMRKQMLGMGYGEILGADGIQDDYNVALQLAWEYLAMAREKEGKQDKEA